MKIPSPSPLAPVGRSENSRGSGWLGREENSCEVRLSPSVLSGSWGRGARAQARETLVQYLQKKLNCF